MPREVADTLQKQIESDSKQCRALWSFQASSRQPTLNTFNDEKNEIELAKQSSQLSLSSSCIAALLNIRDSLGIQNTWTRHQLRYITQKGNDLCTLTPNANTAEKLVSSFFERDDVSYLYVTFKPCDGLLLLTGKC